MGYIIIINNIVKIVIKISSYNNECVGSFIIPQPLGKRITVNLTNRTRMYIVRTKHNKNRTERIKLFIERRDLQIIAERQIL